MMSFRWWCAALVSMILTGAAQAGTVLSPVSANAPDSLSGSPISNTYDQTGLSVGFTSGVTDWNAYFAQNPTKNFEFSDEWFTNSGVASTIVTYDLGSVFSIDNFALWEEDFAGIGSTNVLVSTDRLTYSTILSGIVPTQPAPDENYSAQFFSFATTSARYVELQINACPNPSSTGGYSGCGIGEVAFEGVSAVPEPATWAMMLIGFVGLGLAGRHFRNQQSVAIA